MSNLIYRHCYLSAGRLMSRGIRKTNYPMTNNSAYIKSLIYSHILSTIWDRLRQYLKIQYAAIIGSNHVQVYISSRIDLFSVCVGRLNTLCFQCVLSTDGPGRQTVFHRSYNITPLEDEFKFNVTKLIKYYYPCLRQLQTSLSILPLLIGSSHDQFEFNSLLTRTSAMLRRYIYRLKIRTWAQRNLQQTYLTTGKHTHSCHNKPAMWTISLRQDTILISIMQSVYRVTELSLYAPQHKV